MKIIHRFAQWGDDHCIVLKLDGDVHFNGRPIYKGLPCARWYVRDGGQLVTLTYYPPTQLSPSLRETYVILRSPSNISDQTIADSVGANNTHTDTLSYAQWDQDCPYLTDDHLTENISNVSEK